MVSKLAIATAGVDNLSDRLERVCWLTSGNIVEIGGGEGLNTIRFLKIAREKKTTVIVVDPFEQIPGADESYFNPYTLEKFKQTVTQSEYLADHLHLVQLPSQHEDVEVTLSAYKPIGFMFIDGLQDKKSVFKDLVLAESLGAEIICVDDYDRLTETSQVPMAVHEFNLVTRYKFIKGKREAYFVK